MAAGVLEREAAAVCKAPGHRGDEDLRCPAERHDPGRGIDADPSDRRARQLDLAGVDADPDLEPEGADAVADRHPAAECADRAGEHREEAVAGRVDLTAAIAVDLGSSHSVVIAQQLLPLPVA